ncbi:hypothetical protein [Clostridium weizhouense]|uniref:Uncharacterized protein n=1 Tax=Clostridium weizhouense TaxID=2859781 RepID=A0ABS7ASK7_9CLOT|nr:hypothetical protein [Clostridium weizhouense]MBW6411654.1 hypothetical protein [Clostridium weizhouense]
MEKEFNITGTCIPKMHYMVDTSDKLKKTIKVIDKGKYFTINRPRLYGLDEGYLLIFDFRKIKGETGKLDETVVTLG